MLLLVFRSQVDLTIYTWTAIVFGQCLRFMVSNFLTDSSSLFYYARFYPLGMIVLFLNLFIYKLVLAILL